MTIKTRFYALPLFVVGLFSSLQSTAAEQHISQLNLQVADKVAHIQTMTNNLVVPDAIEIEAIKIKLIAKEMAATSTSMTDIVNKYQLDDSQQRQVIIVVYTSGDGIEP